MRKITLLLLLLFTFYGYSQTQLLSRIDETYNGAIWLNSSGYNYEYDSNNNLESETYFIWDGSTWEELDKTTFAYNANNKATEEIYQSYNSSTGMFENEDRIVYTYNANGDIEGTEGYIWDTGAWSIETRSTINYTGTTLTGGFSEDFDGSVWTNTFQSTINYNGGYISEIIEEEWIGSTWVLDGRDEFSYDGNNKISSVKYENWNGTSWEEAFTTTYVLDGNGNRISETDTFVGAGTETITYTYDMSALMNSFDNPFADFNGLEYLFEDFPYINKILSSTTGTTYRTTYNYDNLLSSEDILNKSQLSLKIYPNPVDNFVTVKSSESIKNIDVFNTLGSKILSTSDLKLNVSPLSKGLYLMNIYLENGSTVTKKIIKN